MSLDACAGLLQRGDPWRLRAALAAPVAARRVLLPLYAFNLEVARAPWVSAEPMIAQMRLQWWRDALSEISAGGPVRRHEVATPLAAVLDAPGAALLDRLVAARLADTEAAPFADRAALEAYLDATGGGLDWAAARALGANPAAEAPVRAFATAAALARYLAAVPALEARGRRPLPDTDLAALARDHRGRWRAARRERSTVGRAAGPALLAGATAGAALARVARSGRPEAATVSEARQRAAAAWLALTGRW